MLLSQLRDKKVIGADGKNLGRVHEVHCVGGTVTCLMVGPGSLIERITATRHGNRIDWAMVREVAGDHIRIAAAAPAPKPKRPG